MNLNDFSSSLIRNFHDVVHDLVVMKMVTITWYPFVCQFFGTLRFLGFFLAKHNRILICQIYIPVLSTHIVHTYVTFTFLLTLNRGKLETILFSDNLGKNVRTA